jgi:hypothetical protein
MEQRFLALSVEDQARVAEQTDLVQRAAAACYAGVSFEGGPDDLRVLQNLINDAVFRPSQTYELQSMGIVFGHVPARATGLKWVMVEDQYGRDPALRWQDTSLVLFPLTMISKRVEAGERPDLQRLFGAIIADVKRAKRVVSPKPWWKFWRTE